MKKLLLTILTFVACNVSNAQTVCAGISPAAIQGNYEYSVQANCGQWPGEVDDGSWGVWSGGLNFNNPGDHIQAELMLVEDGTPGTNPQGNPVSQEGCNMLTNNLTGKIAVVYRNTCWFSSKVYYAQQAGAIGVIVVNREPGLLGMLGNTDPINGPLGIDCTIPAVLIDNVDGAALIAEMQNGPVVMFIGNKLGAFTNDVGAVKGEFIVSPFGGANNQVYDGFTPGIQVYNYGTMDQGSVSINAKIDGPNGNYFDETIGPLSMASGDTVSIFAGNTDEFSAWQEGVGNYDDGDYTLTYEISISGVTDDAVFDNLYETEFKIQSDQISLSRLDAANMPIANSYPSNSTMDYQSCMMFQDPGASALGADGLYVIPHADTSLNDIAGIEIFAYAYEWSDGWVDLDDPNYTFTAASNDAFQSLAVAGFGTDYLLSNDIVDDVMYLPFNTPFAMVDDQRYLFCVQTLVPDIVSYGYDNGINYDGNQGIIRQPISPVYIDGQWFVAGWNGSSAASIAVKTIDPTNIGIGELATLEGSAFPNPTTGEMTISVDANGDASLQVVDVAGKLVMNASITLVNGTTQVDLSSLDVGMYIFNVTLENGQTSQFNVVKK